MCCAVNGNFLRLPRKQSAPVSMTIMICSASAPSNDKHVRRICHFLKSGKFDSTQYLLAHRVLFTSKILCLIENMLLFRLLGNGNDQILDVGAALLKE